MVGAGRFRSGSGKANEFSATVHVIDPLPWSWRSPITRHVASGAMTSIVLPPVRANPVGSPGAQPAPLEFDWMFAKAWTVPLPETAIALQAVSFRASIENGKTRFCLLVATA